MATVDGRSGKAYGQYGYIQSYAKAEYVVYDTYVAVRVADGGTVQTSSYLYGVTGEHGLYWPNNDRIAYTSASGYLTSNPGSSGDWVTDAPPSDWVNINRTTSDQIIYLLTRSYGDTVDDYGPYGADTGWSNVASITISALPVYDPNAPTGASVVRNSDAKATVSWTNHTDSTHPYSGLKIERKIDDGSWVQIATVSAGSTSWIDTGTTSNHYYAYRVRAYNSAGNSSYATTGIIYNTPAAPTNVSAVVASGTNVNVAWNTSAITATLQRIQYRVKSGNTWGAWIELATPAAGVTLYTHTDAPGGVVQYQIRSERDSLVSAYVQSNETVTIQPPAAPTLISLPSANIAVGTQTVRLSWRHNSLDTSLQTAAQVQVSLDGGSSWVTYTVNGATAYYDYNTSSFVDGQAVTFRVRTKGADANYGPYSATASFTMRAVPNVSIVSPANDDVVIDKLPYDIKWTFENKSYSLASYQLNIFDSKGSSVFQKTGTVVEAYTMSPQAFAPSNNSTYSIKVVVIASTGLSASATRQFSVDYEAPANPSIEGAFNLANLATSLQVAVGIEEGKPDTTYMQVYRVMTTYKFNSVAQNLIQANDNISIGSEGVVKLPIERMSTSTVSFSVEDILGGTGDFTVAIEDAGGKEIASALLNSSKKNVLFDLRNSSGSKGSLCLYAGVKGGTMQAGIVYVKPMLANLLDGYVDVEVNENIYPFPAYNRNIAFVQGVDILLVDNVHGSNVFDVTDYVPQLNSIVLYKAVAVSNIGTLSESYVLVDTSSGRRYALNWGDNLSSFAVMYYGVKYDESPERDGEIFYPAGREHGVSFDGEIFEEPIGISFYLIDDNGDDDEETYMLLRDCQRSNTDKVLRLPNGSIFYVNTPAFKFKYDGKNDFRIASFDAEVVDGNTSTVYQWLR